MEYLGRRDMTLLTLFAVLMLGIASSGNPPNGRTGAPGDGLCSNCHSQGGTPEQDGDIDIDGLPASIEPNTTYTLTVTVDNPNGLAVRAGFQMVVLNSQNDNAGSMANPSSSSTVTASLGREYHEHNPAVSYGAGTEVSWTVDWTSPSGPDMDEITAYAAGIVANGAGGNSGDLLVTTTTSGALTGGPLQVSLEALPVTCSGGSDGEVVATATGGVPEYDYLWSTGATTQAISSLPPGSYSVTVTDSDGASAVATAEVTEPEAVEVVASGTPPECIGESNGTATASASGGAPGYSYEWSDGQTGADISGLASGLYTVTATDLNGCTGTSSVAIDDPTAVSVNLVASINPACAGDENGSVEVIGSGGVGGFSYIWQSGQTTALIQSLSAGTYTVTVSDVNGCTAEETYILTDPPGTVINLESNVSASCSDSEDGALEISATGAEPLSFEWSTGSTNAEISGLAPGDYSITVTDNNGCTTSASYTVGAPPAITPALTTTDVTCFGGSDGSIDLVVSGGQAPYALQWSTGDTIGDIGQLTAGNYTVTITDANGCSSTGAAELSQPTQLAVNATSVDESAADANDGQASASPSGGTPPYTYTWTTGSTDSLIQGLTPGDYNVTITDDAGCTAEQTVTVNAFGCALSLTLTETDVTCNGESDGSISTEVSGANGTVTYTWSNGSTEEDITELGAGAFSVTITDASGCIVSANGSVMEPDAIDLICTISDETAPGASNGIIACKVSGGTPPYTLPGDQIGQDSFRLTGLAPGIYEITITDANGCELIAMDSVGTRECQLAVDLPDSTEVCPGFFTTLAPDLGPEVETVEWSTGETTNEIVVSAGSYCVTVTDVNGCTADDCIDVVEVSSIEVELDTVIFDANDLGQILIEVSGGAPPYAFEWFDADGMLVSTERDPRELVEGTYDVVVTDALGCQEEFGSVLVEQPVSTEFLIERFEIGMFPNPASDHVVLRWDAGIEIDAMDIFSGQGQQVLSINNADIVQNGQLDISGLTSGLYYVALYTSEGPVVLKLVKN